MNDYFSIVASLYQASEDSMASMYSAFGLMHAHNGTLIPAKLVAAVFDVFADDAGMSSFAQQPLALWLSDDLEGVYIFTDKNGLVNLWFKPKNGKKMIIEFTYDEEDPKALKFFVAIQAQNKFTFKNRDTSGAFGRTNHLQTDFENFFAKRGLLTSAMGTIPQSENVMKASVDKLFRKRKYSFVPTFIDIQGFEFFVRNSGIPMAGALSPAITQIMVAPGLEDIAPGASSLYMKIDTVVDLELPVGSF